MRKSGKTLLIGHSLAAVWRAHFGIAAALGSAACSGRELGNQLMCELESVRAAKTSRPWLRQKKGRGAR